MNEIQLIGYLRRNMPDRLDCLITKFEGERKHTAALMLVISGRIVALHYSKACETPIGAISHAYAVAMRYKRLIDIGDNGATETTRQRRPIE